MTPFLLATDNLSILVKNMETKREVCLRIEDIPLSVLRAIYRIFPKKPGSVWSSTVRELHNTSKLYFWYLGEVNAN